jgi:hypothetical protein
MKSRITSVLGVVLVCAIILNSGMADVVPQPGALSMSLNLKYLNNMFGMIFPITVQRMIEGKTFPVNFSDSGFLYSVKINNIHVSKYNMTTKTVGFVPGTNNVRLLISGFDLATEVDGAIYALWFIPLSTAGLTVKNITLQLDLAAPTTDNVNWQLTNSMLLDITDV